MILLTGTQRDRLLANGRQRDQDHIPVVEFFNPLGDDVWLATELDADGYIVFVLPDLGSPEQVGLIEIERRTKRDVFPDRDCHAVATIAATVTED